MTSGMPGSTLLSLSPCATWPMWPKVFLPQMTSESYLQSLGPAKITRLLRWQKAKVKVRGRKTTAQSIWRGAFLFHSGHSRPCDVIYLCIYLFVSSVSTIHRLTRWPWSASKETSGHGLIVSATNDSLDIGRHLDEVTTFTVATTNWWSDCNEWDRSMAIDHNHNNGHHHHRRQHPHHYCHHHQATVFVSVDVFDS